MDTFLAICGTGIFAVVATILSPLLLEKLKHKNKKSDEQYVLSSALKETREEIKLYKEETISQISELKTTTEKRMDDIEDKLAVVAEKTDNLITNEVARTYNNIRKQALLAIKSGKIKASVKEDLLKEYDRYKKLPNVNGFLEDIILTMKQLPVIVEDDDLE